MITYWLKQPRPTLIYTTNTVILVYGEMLTNTVEDWTNAHQEKIIRRKINKPPKKEITLILFIYLHSES